MSAALIFDVLSFLNQPSLFSFYEILVLLLFLDGTRKESARKVGASEAANRAPANIELIKIAQPWSIKDFINMTYLSGCEYHNLHLMNLQKVHTSCFTAAAGTRLTCILKVKLYNTCFTTNRTSLQLMLVNIGNLKITGPMQGIMDLNQYLVN